MGDVPCVDADARREPVVPGLGVLHRCPQALEAALRRLAPHDAVHREVRTEGEEVAEKEAANEAGRAGDEDVAKLGRRDGVRRGGPCDRATDEAAERVQVALAVGREDAAERRDPVAGRAGGSGGAVHGPAAAPSLRPPGAACTAPLFPGGGARWSLIPRLADAGPSAPGK